MPKPILIKPDAKLERQIKEAARSEKRKLGPMTVILLERYFAILNGEKNYGGEG